MYFEAADAALFVGHELRPLFDQRLQLDDSVFFFLDLLADGVQVVLFFLEGRLVLAERTELFFVQL